jgi:hypothetical protein
MEILLFIAVNSNVRLQDLIVSIEISTQCYQKRQPDLNANIRQNPVTTSCRFASAELG